MGTYVHYGCALCAPDGWINFDASPALRLQKVPVLGRLLPGAKFPANVRYGDIVRGLKVAPRSAEAVYCSHTLEHLSLVEFRDGLKSTFALLKPGGVFRFVIPDLRLCVTEYVNSTDPQAAVKFLKRTGLGEPFRARGLRGLVIYWLGHSTHRWMWDQQSITVELANAGFTEIRAAQRGDSGDPMFDRVETPSRWKEALGMQCRRPVQ